MGQYGSFSDKNQQVHACMCIHVLYMEFIVQGADVAMCEILHYPSHSIVWLCFYNTGLFPVHSVASTLQAVWRKGKGSCIVVNMINCWPQ